MVHMRSLAESRAGRLAEAGFRVLEHPYRSDDLPSEEDAWRRAGSSLVIPAFRVSDEQVDRLGEVERNWRRIAIEHGVVGGDGRLLISLIKSDPGRQGWTLVSLPSDPVDLGRLGPYPDAPELVAMSITGSEICGVSAEKREMWIINVRLFGA